jgi:hypothetical protein
LLFLILKIKNFTSKMKSLLSFLLLLVTLTLNGQNSNLLNVKSTNGQQNINVSSLIDQQTEYLKSTYSKKIGTANEIVNGKEYVSYYIRSVHKPLLFPKKKRTASLFTSSRKYNNLDLQYDTFQDEVIFTDTTKTINYSFPQIALNKDIVDGFSLYFEDDSMHFKYLRMPECAARNLKEGFYEVVYQEKSQYYIKHLSTYFVREGMNEYEYSPENYISTGGSFYKITGMGSLLKLFGEKSGEIKKYLHVSRIRIRQAGKGEYISILKYYDSLN